MTDRSAFSNITDVFPPDHTHLKGTILDASHKSWQELTEDLKAPSSSGSSGRKAEQKLEDLINKWNRDPEMLDPGFSGGVDAINRRRQQEGVFLRSILHGSSYSDARKAAGMPRDVDPGMGGGEAQVREHALQQAKLLQGITNGMPYQAARLAAGMGRDMDPGMSGGEKQIEQHLRDKAARLGFKPEHRH